MAAALEREVLVEEGPRPRDDLGPAGGVVAGSLLLAVVLVDHVGAVERVVERAPPRVGGVGREPRVQHRDDELWPGLRRDLLVDAGGPDREVLRLLDQVADVAEHLHVGRLVPDRAGVRLVPRVQLLLELLATGQQRPVAGCELPQDLLEATPERRLVDPAAGQRLVADERAQRLCDSEPSDVHPARCCPGHDLLLLGSSVRPPRSRLRGA